MSRLPIRVRLTLAFTLVMAVVLAARSFFVYVRYLRQKIDRPFGRQSLETVRHVGYRLREDGS